jgi:tryptophan halogenase
MIPSGDARAIRSVGIVGGGIVGLSAAIAFARALPKVRVGLLETPPDPAALADRLSGTLSSVHSFHALLGLDEAAVVRAGAANHRLGTRFEQWSADGAPWYHVHGDYGREGGAVPIAFHQLWARARRAGPVPAFDRYSFAALLAEQGRFAHPQQDPNSALSTFSYALRLDPERYRDLLARMAAELPLLRAQGSIADVERREDGGVAAILLEGGRRLEADLFVDCSGPSAQLLSRIDSRFEGWSRWHPVDRLLIAEVADGSAASSCDVTAATGIGWRGSAPLGGRSLVTFAYSSSAAGDEEARRALGDEAAGEAVAIRPGRRPDPWVGNVLAIGDAAEAVDPLQSTNLHLAQSAIMRALGLLPGRDCHPLELREYNRRTEQQTLRIRDFIALHYLRSGRRDGAFWRGLADREPPDSLAHTLEQFERRGRLPYYENESFDRHGWLAVLLGVGVLPRDTDALAAGVDPAAAEGAMAALAGGLAQMAERVPSYRDWLAGLASTSGDAR